MAVLGFLLCGHLRKGALDFRKIEEGVVAKPFRSFAVIQDDSLRLATECCSSLAVPRGCEDAYEACRPLLAKDVR